MPLDGVSARYLAHELNAKIANTRVDRIYQPDRHDILMILHKERETMQLLLSASPATPRLHLTQMSVTNPASPPMFCMLLRKYLLGARLVELTSPGFERVFLFRFSVLDALGDWIEKKLVVEIMGRHSNIILLNDEDTIHDAIHHVDESISRIRAIMPARPYVGPPAQNKRSPIDLLKNLEDNLLWLPADMGDKKLQNALLQTIQGFSPQLCREVIYRAHLDERLTFNQLDSAGLARLNETLRQLIVAIRDHQTDPSVFYRAPDEPLPADFHALPLEQYAIRRQMQSLSDAMDLFYTERTRRNTLNQKKQHLTKIVTRAISQAQRKLDIHTSYIREGENRETLKKTGDLILANLHNWIEGAPVLEAIDYYDPEQTRLIINLEDGQTPQQAAQQYFRRYARAKRRGETGKKLAVSDRREIEWLSSLLHELDRAEDLEELEAVRREMLLGDLLPKGRARTKQATSGNGANDTQPGMAGSRSRRRRQARAAAANKSARGKKASSSDVAPLPPRQFTSSDGLTILVGRNNMQNDELTLRTAQKDDVWLHVKNMPGSHVIVRANRQPVPEQTLLEAAQIAAWYSRATRPDGQVRAASSDTQKVAVDYCPVSHVRKPRKARPGMVIYDHYQTILVSPQVPPDHDRSDP